MLFNYKDLIIKNEEKINKSSIEETSLLIQSLSYISESDNNIREIMGNVMKESYNSDNPVKAFNESFSFGSIIKTIIDFFVENIKKAYYAFKGFLSKIFGGDKVLDKYKSQLLNYSITLKKLPFSHYNYTNLDIDIPPSSLEVIFQEEYDILVEDLNKIGELKEKQAIILELNKLSENISNDKNYFNLLRRKVMSSAYKGGKEAITDTDYIKELKLLFRNNMDTPTNEDIPSYEVRKSAEIFFNNKSLEDSIKAQNKRIEKSAGTMKQKLEKLNPSNFMKEYQPIDYDIEFALNKVLKSKADQMGTACNIILLAYSEKLQAIKDAVIQYKKILHEAVKELIKEGK